MASLQILRLQLPLIFIINNPTSATYYRLPTLTLPASCGYAYKALFNKCTSFVHNLSSANSSHTRTWVNLKEMCFVTSETYNWGTESSAILSREVCRRLISVSGGGIFPRRDYLLKLCSDCLLRLASDCLLRLASRLQLNTDIFSRLERTLSK